MRQTILIDFAKDGTNDHQMDQIMGKPNAAPKIKTSVFMKWPDGAPMAITHTGCPSLACLSLLRKDEMPLYCTTHDEIDIRSFIGRLLVSSPSVLRLPEARSEAGGALLCVS